MTDSGAPSAEAKRAAAIAHIARTLADLQHDQGAALHTVCDEVRRVLGTSSAVVNLIDDASDSFRWAAQQGIPDTLTLEPVPRALFEQYAARFDPIYSETRPEVLAAQPSLTRFVAVGLRCFASATVRSAGSLRGLLTAAGYHHTREPFSAEENLWLQTVADIVVHALDRERAVANAIDSEARYRRIVSTIRDGVWSLDAGLRTNYVNPQMARMLGYTPEEMMGMHLFQFLDERGRHAASVNVERRKRGIGERFDFRYIRKDGSELNAIVSANPIIDPDGRFAGALSVVSDLTEQRGLELKLQHAQKLESLGVLAGGIAHDFNNLLVGVLGNAGLALDSLPPESSVIPALVDIRSAAQRAAELTRQMLAYSGKGRFLIQRLDVNRLVEEMSHLLTTVISKRAILKFNFAANLPPVEADATQIRQVVMNLITNASDSLGDKSGVISISTGLLDVDRAYLGTTYLDEGLVEGDYVFLEVSDTGAGMSAETQEKIFDPFFTTKFTGRGLGLAAVLGILRGHRGAVKVYSELGKGTSFKVLLPAVAGAIAAEVPAMHSLKAYKGQGLVLLADDEESVRAVGKRVLESAGYQVVTAANGKEAVQLFAERPSEFKVVLLDMTMPKMSGEEAFRELRRLAPDVKVVLSSAYNEQDATEHLAGKGIAGFVQKPWLPADLLEALSRAAE